MADGELMIQASILVEWQNGQVAALEEKRAELAKIKELLGSDVEDDPRVNYAAGEIVGGERILTDFASFLISHGDAGGEISPEKIIGTDETPEQ